MSITQKFIEIKREINNLNKNLNKKIKELEDKISYIEKNNAK